MKSAWMLLALAALAVPAQGQDNDDKPEPLYRVEVIAFIYAGGASDAFFTDSLRDFGGLLNPRELADAGRRLREAMAEFARMHPLDAEPVPETSWNRPRAWQIPEQLSPTMARALQRLEDSGSFQPVASHAWYQPVDHDSPRVRVHDDEIVHEQRPEIAPGITRVFDQTAPEDDTGEVEPEPQPVRHYRLDGSARLVQRQFMHLELDLEWREPATTLVGSAGIEDAPQWLVHRLKDSRIIRPDRLEYFDSAWVGVIVRVEEVQRAGEAEREEPGG